MLRTEILTNSLRFSSITQATSLSSTNLLSSRTNHTPKPTISTAQVTPRPAKLLERHVTSAQLRRNRHRSPSPSLLPNHSFVFTHTAPSTSTIPSARSPSKKRIARVKKKKKKHVSRDILFHSRDEGRCTYRHLASAAGVLLLLCRRAVSRTIAVRRKNRNARELKEVGWREFFGCNVGRFVGGRVLQVFQGVKRFGG